MNGAPNGTRTRVSALRGPCPRPLDDGSTFEKRASLAGAIADCQPEGWTRSATLGGRDRVFGASAGGIGDCVKSSLVCCGDGIWHPDTRSGTSCRGSRNRNLPCVAGFESFPLAKPQGCDDCCRCRTRRVPDGTGVALARGGQGVVHERVVRDAPQGERNDTHFWKSHERLHAG